MICNPIASYCYLIGMNCGSQILIFHAVGLQIRQNITLVAYKQRYVPTRLMYRLICNLPELNIRIYNPIASYCYLIGMNCGLKISFPLVLIFHAAKFFFVIA